MPRKILLVDDDANILSGYRRNLRSLFGVEIALGAEIGLEKLRHQGPFAVVVSDLRMPGMDGTRFLAQVRESAPDTVRIMLTGQADLESAIEAVNEGNLFRFLTKPCSPVALKMALDAGVRQYLLVKSERELLENTLGGSIKLLTDVLALASPVAFGRGSRLQRLMRLVLPHFGRENAWQLDVTAMLCQIGLVALPGEILDKIDQGQPLSTEETELLNTYPKIGSELIINIPRLETVAKNIAYQLKRYDGYGPPSDEVRGPEIPLGGRVLKALLDYDTLLRSGRDSKQAAAEMERRSGWSDPKILETLNTTVVDVKTGFTFKMLPIAELESGMVIPDGIRTANGGLLVGKGQEMTPSLLARVGNFARWQEIVEPINVLVPIETE